VIFSPAIALISMVSPEDAAEMASLKVPDPASSALVTLIVAAVRHCIENKEARQADCHRFFLYIGGP